MSRHLDLDLLRTFVAVAEQRSMTAAANVRHLTQSAVSQHIKRLEDMVGHQLVDRERRNLGLTPTGERLLAKAVRLLAQNDEIWADLVESRPRGSVRLGVALDLIGPLVAPLLKTYADAYPDVELHLKCTSSTELKAALQRGELDVAIVEEAFGSHSGECLRTDRLVWTGAKGGSAHLKSPLPLSMVVDTCAFRPVVVELLQKAGRDWRAVFENGNKEATTATVRADLAVTPWLASILPHDLVILTPSDGLPELPIFAISLQWAKGKPSVAATVLADMLRNGITRSRQVG